MRRSFLYISVHHQAIVAGPANGTSLSELQFLTDGLFRPFRSADAWSELISPEISLGIMQECLEQNEYLYEKAAMFDGYESRTIILAIVLAADTDCPIPDCGLWYRSADEREGLAYFAQMALVPYSDSLIDSLDRYQSGIEQVRRVLSRSTSDYPDNPTIRPDNPTSHR